MSLYNTYNNEDILSRAVIAGMLNVLNDKIIYNQVWTNEEIEQVKVPWFYNQSGDERFMQDFYTHYADCNFPRPVDGNFDVIPRGVITYTGSAIDATRITNRFVQGRYMKEVDGKLQSYVSFLYSIPLTVNFDCEIWVDTQITALKLEQAIREYFYKTVTFYVYYKGIRVGCTSGFSESITIDKLIKYSFESENRIKLNFTIEVETYQPVFDPTTEMNANNYIKKIGMSLYQMDQKDDGAIEITNPVAGITVPKGIPLNIEWDYTREGAIIHTVDAYWLYTNTNEWILIEKGIPNHQFWYWNIPADFTNYQQPAIIWEETNNIKIHNQPVISIIPEEFSGKITAASFIINKPGYFMTPTTDASIAIILEMKDEQSRISYTGDNQIYINIANYQIDTNNPVWVDPSANIIYPGILDFRTIDIHIANSTNNDVFGVVKNIKVL